jgi:hypothetical protein
LLPKESIPLWTFTMSPINYATLLLHVFMKGTSDVMGKAVMHGGADQTTSLRGDPQVYLNMKVALPGMERQTSNQSNGEGVTTRKLVV